MIPQKAISIINSCQTHLQLDTCANWIEYIYEYNEQCYANAIIQQRRNQIDITLAKFAPDHIKHVQSLEH